MTTMAVQIWRKNAPILNRAPNRAERENTWLRRAFALGGAKRVEAELSCTSDRARSIWSGRLRLNDTEKDILTARYGHEWLDAIESPGLAAYLQSQRAAINAEQQRLALLEARLSRRSADPRETDPDSVGTLAKPAGPPDGARTDG